MPSMTRYPTTAINRVGDEGVSWTDPENVLLHDGIKATLDLSGGGVGKFLQVGNFNFSIPYGATLLDIKVETLHYANAGSSIGVDVYGDINGDYFYSVVGMQVADDNVGDSIFQWGSDEGYGGSLGSEISVEYINSNDFFLLFFSEAFDVGTQILELDFIRVTVFYEGGEETVLGQSRLSINRSILSSGTASPPSVSGYSRLSINKSISLQGEDIPTVPGYAEFLKQIQFLAVGNASGIEYLESNLNLFLSADYPVISKDLDLFVMSDFPTLSRDLTLYIKGDGLNVGYYPMNRSLNLFIEGTGDGDPVEWYNINGDLTLFIKGVQYPTFYYDKSMTLFLKVSEGNLLDGSMDLFIEGKSFDVLDSSLDLVIPNVSFSKDLTLFVRGI